ncbi:MAG: hypothetical protein KTR27_02670 [Leptolyngbyaceae cyanobacterium MAG.088]|nr:hypothetical protein [Leptolyngbyaceae cyanobacterium MAG.088]
MIISRRKLHLFSSIALAIIMPIIFIAGLLFRPTYATVTPDTDQLLSQSLQTNVVLPPSTSNAPHQNSMTAFLRQPSE